MFADIAVARRRGRGRLLPFMLGINQGPINSEGNAAPFNDYITGEIQNGGQLPDANRDANGDIASSPNGNNEFSIAAGFPLDGSELTLRWNDTGVVDARVLNATGVVIDIPNRAIRFTPNYSMAGGTVSIGVNTLVTVGDYSHAPKGFTLLKSGVDPTTAPKFTNKWLANVKALTGASRSNQRPPMRLMKWTTVELNNGGNTAAWCGGTQASPVAPITWANRSTTRNHSWRIGPQNDGRPLEDLIDAANAANVDLWWTAPWNADADYVVRAATLIRDRLNPWLRLWVEVSNEVWNWGYTVATQCLNEANALGISRHQRYAQKSLEIFALINGVFSGAMSRLIRVLNWQQGATGDYDDIIAWPGVVGGVDALGSSPYWMHGQAANYTGDPAQIWSDGWAYIDSICNWLEILKTKCVAHGFRYAGYEAGQSYFLDNDPFNEAIQLDPQMGQQYDYFHYRLSKILGPDDVLCQFCQAFYASGRNKFGILENEGSAMTLAAAPKAYAISRFASGIKPPQIITGAFNVAPNAANGTSLGTPSRLWADSTFSAANNDGGRITVNAATGEVTVANGALLSSAETRSFTFREKNPAFPAPGYVDTVFNYTVAVPWTPAALNPKIWIEPSTSTVFVDAGVTNVGADGQAVQQVNDKSGNGHNLTQATANARPVYKAGGGKPFLLFDGADDTLGSAAFAAADASGQHWVAVAFNFPANPGNSVYICSLDDGSGNLLMSEMKNNAGNLGALVWDSGQNTISDGPGQIYAAGTPVVGIYQVTSNSVEFFQNGVSDGPTTIANGPAHANVKAWLGCYLGFASFGNVEIYGYATGAGVLSADDRAKLQSHMASLHP